MSDILCPKCSVPMSRKIGQPDLDCVQCGSVLSGEAVRVLRAHERIANAGASLGDGLPQHDAEPLKRAHVCGRSDTIAQAVKSLGDAIQSLSAVLKTLCDGKDGIGLGRHEAE